MIGVCAPAVVTGMCLRDDQIIPKGYARAVKIDGGSTFWMIAAVLLHRGVEATNYDGWSRQNGEALK